MGRTHIVVSIANPARPRRLVRVTCLVDSGAAYSLIPSSTLRTLGIVPHTKKIFTLADGTQVSRRVGDAVFVLDGHRAASPVIFGKKGDAALLGVVSLEALGLILDPLKRELRPLPLVLG